MKEFTEGPWIKWDWDNMPSFEEGQMVQLRFKNSSVSQVLPGGDLLALIEKETFDSKYYTIADYRLIGCPPTTISTNTPRAHQEGGDHYKKMDVQPWDVIDTWPLEQRIGFYRGNALKYVMRMGSKDERLTEIKKARHYLDKLITTLEKPNA